jgi:uncharacterized protein
MYRDSATNYEELARRMGSDAMHRRLSKQQTPSVKLFGSGLKLKGFGFLRFLHTGIKLALRISGLYHIGHRNALNLSLVENSIRLPNLPQAFNGLRILHLSDTHIDRSPDLLPLLSRLLSTVHCDLCLFTGDFREGSLKGFRAPTEQMSQLLNQLQVPTYAILGNHDLLEMVPPLEEKGIRILLNEHVPFHRNGETIYLAGVDDPHYFKSDDLPRALNGIPKDAFTLLLAHAPLLADAAEKAGCNLYLCGHLHGGQICLPNGKPILARSRVAHDQGNWQLKQMQGYTSRGTGCSSIAIRFNCPPEITLHTLQSL